VVLARSAGVQELASWLQLLLFALAIASSIATAEIIADYLLPLKLFGTTFNNEQPAYAWMIFWCNLSIMCGLLVIAVFRRRKTKRRIQ